MLENTRTYLALLLAVTFLSTTEVSSASGRDSVLVEGFVVNRITLERLGDATVILNRNQVTTTNQRGYFSAGIIGESLSVKVILVGFHPVEKHLELDAAEESVDLFFQLTPAPVEMESILVQGVRPQSPIEQRALQMTLADLKAVPVFAASDPFRSVQALPGVTQAMSDFDAHMYVRGGQAYETQIFLDGIPVYNAYHLSGWFSMFSMDILRSEVLYRSACPPSLGGGLSGTLALNSKTGGAESYRGSASLGIPSLEGFVEGPLGGGTFVLSARRTYLDIASGLFANGKEGKFPYHFYDLFGKYTRNIGQNDVLSVNLFHSRDSFDPFGGREMVNIQVEDPLHCGNQVVGLSHTHQFEHSVSLTASFYYSGSTVSADARGQDVTYTELGMDTAVALGDERWLAMHTGLHDAGGRIAFELPVGAHRIQAGAFFRRIGLQNAWSIAWPSFSDIEEIVLPRAESFFDYAPNDFAYNSIARSFGIFVSDNIEVNEYLSLSMGYRLEKVLDLDFTIHSPSATVAYKLLPEVEIAVGVSRSSQYLYCLKETKTSNNLFSAFSATFLAREPTQIGTSDQITMGARITRLPFSAELDIEGYYYKRRNIPSSYAGLNPLYTFEPGYAAGVDVLLKAGDATLSGWVAYSVARSVKHGQEYWYFSGSDRTHTVKAILNSRPFEAVGFNVFWTHATGVPFTDVVGAYLGLREGSLPHLSDGEYLLWKPVEGRKNSARATAYERLDIGITGYFIWGEVLVMPFVSVFNVTRSFNPFFLDWEKDGSIEDTRHSEVVPSFGVKIEF